MNKSYSKRFEENFFFIRIYRYSMIAPFTIILRNYVATITLFVDTCVYMHAKNLLDDPILSP